MARRRDSKEKAAKEPRGLVVLLVLSAAAGLWFGFSVLPDMLMALFLNPTDLPPAP